MVKEPTSGPMVAYSLATGSKIKCMALENSPGKTVALMKASTKMTKSMVMASLPGPTAVSTTAIGLRADSTV